LITKFTALGLSRFLRSKNFVGGRDGETYSFSNSEHEFQFGINETQSDIEQVVYMLKPQYPTIAIDLKILVHSSEI